MTVAQLIELLKNQPQDWPVYARQLPDGCCSSDDWDTVTEVEPAMITEYVWENGRRVPKSINVIKLDVY